MKKNTLSIFKNILQLSLFSFSLVFTYDHKYPPNWDEFQSNEGWKLIKETKRVKIYNKQLGTYPLPAVKAELLSKVKMDRLVDAAWLVEKSKEVFPNAYITDAGIYYRRDDTSYTAFQIIDIPFLSPRLYQFNSIRLQNSIQWARADTLEMSLNPQNILLPPVNFGSWEVEQYGEKTKLIYRVCTDPGGKIPKWIIKMANQQVLPKMLIDLEKYAKEHIESK